MSRDEMPLQLEASTAADLMQRQVVTLELDATLRDAAALLIDHRISGVPVIDAEGRPVGVVSATDIVDHARRAVAPEASPVEDRLPDGQPLPDGFEVERVDASVAAGALMTPVVMAVEPQMPARSVVEVLLLRRLHRVFVVDPEGALLGVISTFDVLRHLR